MSALERLVAYIEENKDEIVAELEEYEDSGKFGFTNASGFHPIAGHDGDQEICLAAMKREKEMLFDVGWLLQSLGRDVHSRMSILESAYNIREKAVREARFAGKLRWNSLFS